MIQILQFDELAAEGFLDVFGAAIDGIEAAGSIAYG